MLDQAARQPPGIKMPHRRMLRPPVAVEVQGRNEESTSARGEHEESTPRAGEERGEHLGPWLL